MKLLFVLLMMGFSPIRESRQDRFPTSSSEYAGCDPRETATGIQNGSKSPRETLFHYGKKELLMKDVAEGNIPESDWNDYIMGEVTRFKLKRFRRGFYGTEYAEDADRFGDSTYNWLVEIKLKSECLKPNRVTSLVYLPGNPDFQKWYESKTYEVSFDKWKASCFDEDVYPRSKYFISYKNPGDAADFKESICEQVIAQYYEEQKFAFVQDYVGDLVRSWAIRDRNCIASIEGSDAYWVKAFANRSELWVNSCSQERNHRNNIRVWFSAMASEGVSVPVAEKFLKMVMAVKAPEDNRDWASEEMDRFAVQDFAPAFVAAVKRCGSAKKQVLHEEFREISSGVDQMQSADVKAKLEKLCR